MNKKLKNTKSSFKFLHKLHKDITEFAKQNHIRKIVLDVDTDKYECCSYSNDKKKRQQICIDPITGEKCSLCALRLRKYRWKGPYKDIDLKSCITGDIDYET